MAPAAGAADPASDHSTPRPEASAASVAARVGAALAKPALLRRRTRRAAPRPPVSRINRGGGEAAGPHSPRMETPAVLSPAPPPMAWTHPCKPGPALAARRLPKPDSGNKTCNFSRREVRSYSRAASPDAKQSHRVGRTRPKNYSPFFETDKTRQTPSQPTRSKREGGRTKTTAVFAIHRQGTPMALGEHDSPSPQAHHTHQLCVAPRQKRVPEHLLLQTGAKERPVVVSVPVPAPVDRPQAGPQATRHELTMQPNWQG